LATASAADDKKLTPQQEKMKLCNTEAGDKTGHDRKAFMSQCLKARLVFPRRLQRSRRR